MLGFIFSTNQSANFTVLNLAMIGRSKVNERLPDLTPHCRMLLDVRVLEKESIKKDTTNI
jgi:hypothetical protein